MKETNTNVMEVSGVSVLYEETAEMIATILRLRYNLTTAQAEEAVRTSPLESVFQIDPEMAAHTSNEKWAKEVLDYWKRHQA